MPGFPFPGRPGGEHGEPLLDMIFSGRAVPPDAPQEVHDLARLLAALAGPAEPGELAGEAAARAAFSHLVSPARISPRAPRPARQGFRRPGRHGSRRPARTRVGLAAALTVTAAALAGAAAYVGLLPGPIQLIAHEAVGAPAPHHHREVSGAAGSLQDTRGQRPPASHPAPQPAGAAGATKAAGRVGVAKPAYTPPGRGTAVDGCPTARTWQYPALPGLRFPVLPLPSPTALPTPSVRPSLLPTGASKATGPGQKPKKSC